MSSVVLMGLWEFNMKPLVNKCMWCSSLNVPSINGMQSIDVIQLEMQSLLNYFE